jgi:hypothetical protein
MRELTLTPPKTATETERLQWHLREIRKLIEHRGRSVDLTFTERDVLREVGVALGGLDA